jgi:branched-chain amino acid transport system permease protein
MKKKKLFSLILPVLILWVGIFFFPLFGNKYLISLMIFVGIYALVVIGLSLLIGYAGQISLGHSAFFGLGAYTSGILTATYHVNPWVALVLAILLTIGFAYVIALPTLRLKGPYLAMATLGFGEIAFIAFSELIGLTGGPSGLIGIPELKIGGYMFSTDVRYYYLVWVFVLCAFLLSLNIIHSRVGRALRSINDSERAAQAMGVNTGSLKIQVFVLSAAYASVAGSLFAHFLTFLNPLPFSIEANISLILMVVVGGMTNLWGSLIGSGLIVILPEMTKLTKSAEYNVIIFGLLLVLIIIFLPQGLVMGLIVLGKWIKNLGIMTRLKKETSKRSRLLPKV